MRKWIMLLIPVVLVFGFVRGQTQTQITGRMIMERVDLNPQPRTSVANLKLVIETVHGGEVYTKVRELIRYKKDYDSGEYTSKTMLRFVKPLIAKGIGYLSWQYRNGDYEQWLFLPRLKVAKKISRKDKSHSFMGTEFSYEELSGRDLDAAVYSLVDQDTCDGDSCYVIDATPLGESQYSRRRIWVNRRQWIIKRVEFFNDREQKVKILSLPEHEKISGYWTVKSMIMRNLQNGNKTTLTLSDVRYNTGLRDDFFTETFLVKLDW